jgi:branched-chain amino acid transport system permease protein
MDLFDSYTESILINMGINMILALSLYLPLSTGQLSIGQAGFMAVGAYTAAGLTTFQGAPFYPSILAGGIMAALVAFLVGFPALRLKGLYLALMTFGFGEIVRVFFLNFEPLGGARGIVGISFDTQLWHVYAVIAIVAVFLYRLSHSRMGRAFEAIKEDELAAESMGVNPTWAKLCAFAAGGFIAGIGGGLYAHYIQFIQADTFGFDRAVDILMFAVLGGMDVFYGPLLGAAILTLLPEYLRVIQEWRIEFYGVIMILVMIFRPQGILGKDTLSWRRWLGKQAAA